MHAYLLGTQVKFPLVISMPLAEASYLELPKFTSRVHHYNHIVAQAPSLCLAASALLHSYYVVLKQQQPIFLVLL